MIERVDPSTVTVTIYHACPAGASGSALGPYDLVSYWWAEPGRIRIVGAGAALHRRDAVEAAVVEALGGSVADRVRAAQDAAAEAIA